MATIPPVFTSMTMPVPPLAASYLSSILSRPFSRAYWTLVSRVSTKLLPFSASNICSPPLNNNGVPFTLVGVMVSPVLPLSTSS